MKRFMVTYEYDCIGDQHELDSIVIEAKTAREAEWKFHDLHWKNLARLIRVSELEKTNG